MLNATRFTTYALIRAEVLNYLRPKQAAMALSGPAPMDLDALAFGKFDKDSRGRRGKDKNKGKGYDQSAIQPCKYCGKKGHKLMECRKATQDMMDGKITKEGLRNISKGKGKGKDKSDKAKNTPAPDKPKDQDM
eukprot:4006923-Pyramimonas_sp.AAC.1